MTPVITRTRPESRCSATAAAIGASRRRRPRTPSPRSTVDVTSIRRLGRGVSTQVEMGSRRVEQSQRRLLPVRLPAPRLREGRQDPARGAGRLAAADRAGHPRHESDGLPEGRVLAAAARRSRSRHAAAPARGRARRGQVRAGLVGRGAHRDRRRDARRHPGTGTRVDHRPDDARDGCVAGAHLRERDRRRDHRRQRRVPRLQPRLPPDVGRLQSRRVDGRLVPRRPDTDLAREPRLHLHHDVPLPRRVAVQRRRDRHDRARLLALRGPCRLSPADPDRHRRRARARDVQGDHRRGSVSEAVRAGADRPVAAGAHRHRPVSARQRRRGGRPRRPVLLVGRADRRTHARSARHARRDRRRAGARGQLPRAARRRQRRRRWSPSSRACAASSTTTRRRRPARSARSTPTTSARSRARWPRARPRSSSAATRASPTTAT